jgi:hypothetical protein
MAVQQVKHSVPHSAEQSRTTSYPQGSSRFFWATSPEKIPFIVKRPRRTAMRRGSILTLAEEERQPLKGYTDPLARQ